MNDNTAQTLYISTGIVQNGKGMVQTGLIRLPWFVPIFVEKEFCEEFLCFFSNFVTAFVFVATIIDAACAWSMPMRKKFTIRSYIFMLSAFVLSANLMDHPWQKNTYDFPHEGQPLPYDEPQLSYNDAVLHVGMAS